MHAATPGGAGQPAMFDSRLKKVEGPKKKKKSTGQIGLVRHHRYVRIVVTLTYFQSTYPIFWYREILLIIYVTTINYYYIVGTK